jgi:hypothetical protein
VKALKILAARANKNDLKRHQLHRELICREATIGGQLFGPVAQGVRREFVCVNKHTWLWHEEWVSQGGVIHSRTTLYDVREDGVYKMQDDDAHVPVSSQEAKHLRAAALLYHQQVITLLYNN